MKNDNPYRTVIVYLPLSKDWRTEEHKKIIDVLENKHELTFSESPFQGSRAYTIYLDFRKHVKLQPKKRRGFSDIETAYAYEIWKKIWTATKEYTPACIYFSDKSGSPLFKFGTRSIYDEIIAKKKIKKRKYDYGVALHISLGSSSYHKFLDTVNAIDKSTYFNLKQYWDGRDLGMDLVIENDDKRMKYVIDCSVGFEGNLVIDASPVEVMNKCVYSMWDCLGRFFPVHGVLENRLVPGWLYGEIEYCSPIYRKYQRKKKMCKVI